MRNEDNRGVFSSQVGDYGESSTDDSSMSHPVSVLPGYKTSFVAIGRNLRQWRQCVNLNESKFAISLLDDI